MSVGSNGKSVAIKTLVEFAAKQGGLNWRFTPAPTGQEGIEGHQQVRKNRSASYRAELNLAIEYEGIQFRGR
ncbi:MAG TPA: hypothetical protein VFM18_03740, partial [Methanosarcina sp.]|nr:hypothetical protein [Methanosarcina sp.]